MGIGTPQYEDTAADEQNGEQKKRKSVIYASSLALREHVLSDR